MSLSISKGGDVFKLFAQGEANARLRLGEHLRASLPAKGTGAPTGHGVMRWFLHQTGEHRESDAEATFLGSTGLVPGGSYKRALLAWWGSRGVTSSFLQTSGMRLNHGCEGRDGFQLFRVSLYLWIFIL